MEEKTIVIHKAQPLMGDDVPSLNILIDQEVPEFQNLSDADFLYQQDAEQLCAALYDTLPGGMFDRLVVEMLKRTISQLKVSYKE
jgi:hypothetical protein